MKEVWVLAGGGAKGLIQVACLAALESKNDIMWTKQDLFVCTSVGAINGSVLSSGALRANGLLKQYESAMNLIFKPILWPIVPKYSRKNFLKAWYQMMPSGCKFKDLEARTIIVSIDACGNIPHFFKSYEDKDGNENLVDVVQRSFAAPYYFGQINDPKNSCVWYDGGCGVHNMPIDYAWEEVCLKKWFPYEPVRINVVGTGMVPNNNTYNEVSQWKVAKQIKLFLDPDNGGMARAQSKHEQVLRMINRCRSYKNVHFRYFDAKIPEELDKMDNIAAAKQYIEIGRKMAENPIADI